MHFSVKILAGVVALKHIAFLILEMFLWETRDPSAFSQFPQELFTPTKVLVATSLI